MLRKIFLTFEVIHSIYLRAAPTGRIVKAGLRKNGRVVPVVRGFLLGPQSALRLLRSPASGSKDISKSAKHLLEGKVAKPEVETW